MTPSLSLRPALDLGECLGRGGEATIFALRADPDTIAKLYHQPRSDRAEKLALMIARPPDPIRVNGHTVIAWPTRRLFCSDGTGRVSGCLMPRVTGGIRAAELHNMKSRLLASPQFTWKYLVRAARNLAVAVQRVHAAGYVIGDVNDQGVLVTDSALVSLVDCDSFQVADAATGRVYRCPVGTGAYTPAELKGCRFADVDRHEYHDRFGLAVLIYQLLMGCHPFQVKAPDDEDAVALEDAIVRGLYPDAAADVVRAPVAPPVEMLPETTRALFRVAFAGAPHERPPAQVWAEELWAADSALRACPRNTNHHFAVHLSGCPWCDRTEALGGRDPFPSPDAIRAGDHLRRPVAPQYSWSSPRPRAHYDRRRRRQAHPAAVALARLWRPRSRS
jgi:DNA-binding helix-hairpin-helix protein with protein kinase domain